MAKKDNNGTPANLGPLGEISTIRDILMGQQINEIDQRFQQLEERIQQLELELDKKTKELEQLQQKNSDTITRETNRQFEDFNKLFTKTVDRVDRDLVKLEERRRTELGQIFQRMSKKLLEQ